MSARRRITRLRMAFTALIGVVLVCGCRPDTEAPEVLDADAESEGSIQPGSNVEVAVGHTPASFRESTEAQLVSQSGHRDASHLPSERIFSTSDGLSVEKLGLAIGGQEWASAIARIEHEAFSDPDALALQALYEDWLGSTLSTQQLALSEFACGLSFCAGTVRLESAQAHTAYEEWHELLLDDRTLPLPAIARYEYAGPGEQSEGRFVFSTDPAAPGFTGRM